MMAIGGLASAGTVLSGFLWNFIVSVRKELLAYIRSVKSTVQKNETEYANHLVEAERRFALRSDVQALRDHIDKTSAEQTRHINERFDQLISLFTRSAP